MNRNNIIGFLYPQDNKIIYASVFSLIVLIHLFINQFHVPNMDEIWNYQFARRILYGQIPFRDFLMLNTPFSAQINALMLSVFSDKLIVMRLVAAFIAGFNGTVFFVILRLIGKTMIASSFYTSILILVFLLNPQNNYSWYAVLFLSLTLLFEVLRLTSADGRKWVCDYLVGACLGAVMITKQNIGAAGLVAAMMFCSYIYSTRERNSSNGNRDLFKNLLYRLAGWSTVVGAELFWMVSNGSVYAMIQLQGNLSDFTSYGFEHMIYWFKEPYVVTLFSVVLAIIAVAYIMTLDPKISMPYKRILMLLALYSSANFTMVYPMPDPAHIWFGMPLSIVTLGVLSEHPRLKHTFGRGIYLGILTVLLVLLLVPLQRLQTNGHYNHYDLKHYDGIPLSKGLYENTVAINEYILYQEKKGQNVFFLNYQAPRFLIPLDKFNYRYDTLLTGDIGSMGEKDIIEKISTTENAVVVIAGIPSEMHRFESQAIRDYVRSNMKYTDHLHGFDVYTR